MKQRILIIDDESSICISLSLALQPEFAAEWDTDPLHGLERLRHESFDLVLLDMIIGNHNGLDILDKIKEIDPQIAVIMMTAYGSIASSVSAIRKGAFTYLTKPLNMEELLVYIHQAMEIRMMSSHIAYLNEQLESQTENQVLIGHSPAIRKLREMIELFSQQVSNVLICGESGTGKDLVAHELFRRVPAGFFVPLRCSAYHEQQLKEELFGYRSGQLPNSGQNKIGKLQRADQGTLYLDEIEDMPLSIQAMLLKALQEGCFTPVGSRESLPFSCRVLSSSSRDLREMVLAGKFRSDLYYRLNTLELTLPPLRERKEDIPHLCDYFIRCQRAHAPRSHAIMGLSSEALSTLMKHDFPGNIRELQNILDYAGLLSKTPLIEASCLPFQLTDPASLTIEDHLLRGKTIQALEKITILSSYKRNQGKRKDIASELGISERSLWNKLKQYGLN